MTSSDMAAIWPGTLLIGYLAITSGILLVGRERVSGLALGAHFAVLASTCAVTWLRAVPAWLRAWAPLLLLLFLYSEMPAIIAAAGHATLRDTQVIGWEAAIFNAQPAAAWARAWPSLIFSESIHLAYLLYYPIIFVVPAILYAQRRRVDFGVAVGILMTTFVLCFICYAAFPVAGPRYLWESAAPDGPFRLLALFLLESGSSQGTAFPSSHVAVATTQSVLAIALLGRPGLLIAGISAGLAAGAVYGGFHYAIDVVAGLGLGGIVATAGLVLTRSTRAQAKAIAPT